MSDGTVTGTSGNDNLNGGSGDDLMYGGDGSDKLSGGSGADTLDGGTGSDSLNGGSGSDTLIYNLSENAAAGTKDVYTGGSGIDTVLLQLSESQWQDPGVRAKLQAYVQFLATVKTNAQQEVSNGSASDFVFDFGNGVTLTVQMMEQLAVSVQSAPGGPYMPIDYLAALITGPATGTVVEAGGVNNAQGGMPTASGNLYADDLNGPDDVFQVVAPGAASASGYGSYSVTADGVWTYTLSNASAAVQALNVGASLTDSFTVLAADGASKVVTVTINGSNDAAVITGPSTGTVVEAGGVVNGTPGTPTASGDLLATDLDNAADSFQAVAAGAATANGYGSYAITADGVWTYTLNNSNAAVQALNSTGANTTLSDSFTVYSEDGTAQLVNVTINGSNDAAVISGTTAGTVVEAGGVANGNAGTPTASGDLLASDVDNPTDAFQAVAAGAATSNGYGSYALSAEGVWTYSLDNDNASVQALNSTGANTSLTDSFTVYSADGTAQVVTVTIDGSNDAAVVTGTAGGTVVEAGGVANGNAGTPTASGDLLATDVDNAADAFQAVSAGAATANGYGSYALTADGVWTYTLDNAHAAVQALNSSGASTTLTDSFTVYSADGTAQVVSVTINGTNDAAVITGTASGTVVEAGGVGNDTPGTPTATGNLLATDVDNPADAFQPVAAGTATANGYGSYALSADGVWTYSLDNGNAAVQALNSTGANTSLTDSFTVYSEDGTAQLVTVTINGSNDAAVITGTASGTLTEAGGVANDIPGIAATNGDLLASDVDNPIDAFQAVAAGAATANGYGSYALSADGVWTYTLDNGNAAVQALNSSGANTTLTDSFTAYSEDGTAQLVNVTINGTNDAAVITGTVTGTVVEAGGVANGTPGMPTATGDLLATDVDNAADAFQAVSSGGLTTNGYGSYALTADGVWTYTLDNANTAVQALNSSGGNTTLSDSFTVYAEDGTAQVVTVTINGTNDAAVIAGTASGTLVEAGGVANGLTGTPTATGDLQATDVDNTADAFQAVAAGSGTVNGYGSYALSANGVWTYTLDNDNASVQALNSTGANTSLTDSFTVYSADGTAQVVSVTINGSNDAAVITGTSTGTVVEAGGVANGTPGTPTATGDLLASDVDNTPDAFQAVAAGGATTNGYGSFSLTAGGVWTYTLDNANAAVQALNSTGSPTTLADSFTVYSEDGTSQLVSVTIQGSNDAPVITSNGGGASATVSISENTTTVTTVTASDVDSTTLSYVIAGGADAARFTIDGDTGALAFAAAPDFDMPADAGSNNVYDVIVRAFDGSASDDQALAVTVTNVNEAPVITSNGGGATAAVSVAENATLVTMVTTTDPDAGSVLSYAIAGGADAALFTIDASTGALSFVSAPNYEAPGDTGADNVYDVAVAVSDGQLSDTQAIAVTVTPVNEFAPVITSNGGGATAAISVAENTTAVTTVTATDADLPAAALNYSIAGGSDAARFTINAATGALAFLSAPNVELPTDSGSNNVYDVTVRVSDGVLSDTQAIAVTVTPVNEFAPAITSNGGGATAAISVAENSTAVTAVTATDADLPAPTFTYSIAGGADAARFTINASTGSLAFVAAPDFEAPADAGANNVYDVTVQVSDGSQVDTQAIAVTVTDVIENANTLYTYSLAAGNNVIADAGGTDAIQITGTPVTSLNFERVGNDLVIDANATHIVVTGQYAGAGNAVETISFTGGGSGGGSVYGYGLGTGAYNLNVIGTADDVAAGTSGPNNPLDGGNGGGDDLLFGNAGIDNLTGDNGLDLLVGGLGNDTLNGGGQDDVFVFNTALNAVTNVDTIQDFDGSGDRIALDDDIFTAFSVGTPTTLAAGNFHDSAGGNAADGDDYILYDTATGNLFYDSDGNGAGGKVLFATLTLAGVSGTVGASDFLIAP